MQKLQGVEGEDDMGSDSDFDARDLARGEDDPVS
jgi:hypothetical protein